MRPRAATVIVALTGAFAVWLAGPGPAHAAFEIGFIPTDDRLESCAAGLDTVQTSSSVGAGYEVPADGVITSWAYRSGSAGAATIRLQVWRPTGGAGFKLEGRSDPVVADGGDIVELPAQIPVSAGSMLGLRSITESGCISDDSFSGTDIVMGRLAAADPVIGESVTMTVPGPTRRLNVAATIEPDADGDGFGDESQNVALAVKLKNKLRAKRSGFPVKIACGGSDCDATVSGKVIAKQKGGKSAAPAKKAQKFKLKPKTISIGADATEKTKLKLKKHSKTSRKLSSLLKSDKAYRKGSKLKLTVSAANSLGAADALKDTAKLKP